jgi:hypothetical protein
MRTIAVFANIVLLFFVCVEFSSHGIHPQGAYDLVLVLLITVTPVLSLIALFSMKKGEGWLDLFLKRKALEEQNKIDELRKHLMGNKSPEPVADEDQRPAKSIVTARTPAGKPTPSTSPRPPNLPP